MGSTSRSKIGEHLVAQFDDVKAVEHDSGLGRVALYGADIGGRHVDGYGAQAASLASLNPSPERR